MSMNELWETDSTHYSRLNQDISHAFGLAEFEFPSTDPNNRVWGRTDKAKELLGESAFYLPDFLHDTRWSNRLLESLPGEAKLLITRSDAPEPTWDVSISVIEGQTAVDAMSRSHWFAFSHPRRAAAESICYLAYRFDSGELRGIFPERAEWLRSMKGKIGR